MLDDLFPPHESRESGRPDTDRFRELHLYHGSRCNRSCDFCTVSGDPTGWHAPFPPEVLDAALRWTVGDGNLKIYGGEPTLDLSGLLAAMHYLRSGGFDGWFSIFSNGVLADRVIELLETDDRSEVVLNYSILYGTGAEPLPARSLEVLSDYARSHPGTLYASHPDLAPVGRGARLMVLNEGRPAFGGKCPRCRPVLTSRGELRACPFAVDDPLPQHGLASTTVSATAAIARHQEFLRWIDSVIEPEASRRCQHPCAVCVAGDVDEHTLRPVSNRTRRSSG